MKEGEHLHIDSFMKEATKIYSLHDSKLNNKNYYAKVFYEKLIHESMNIDSLEYN